jgi:hypothetical protein
MDVLDALRSSDRKQLSWLDESPMTYVSDGHTMFAMWQKCFNRNVACVEMQNMNH